MPGNEETANESKIEKSQSNKVSKSAYGIDISKFQGNEISKLRHDTDSISFIICKATEGITYTDPIFLSNWSRIKADGFIRGSYHFYRTNDSPEAQAGHYISTTGGLLADDLPPIVDFEEGSIQSTQPIEDIQKSLISFLNIVTQKTKRTPIIYTDLNTGNKYLSNPEFSKYPLWIANYNSGVDPEIPTTWKIKDWTFWQKSDDYILNGTTNDYDIFNGTISELKEFINTH